MALYLITGLPGSAKTLFTLFTVENRRIADNKMFRDEWIKNGSDEENAALERKVYYYNIRIFRHKLPHWLKMEKPSDWLDAPNGSLFVFDECQEAFEPLNNSEKRPEYYKELSKHRHRGHDMYFMTQHPTYVDTYVRKNVEEHTHLMRPFGAKTAIAHVWKGVKENCDKTRKDSMSSRFKHPKHVYSWYKSAEVHTYKLKIPIKVLAILLLPLIMAASVYAAYNHFDKKITTAKPDEKSASILDPLSPKKTVSHTVEYDGFDVASYKPRFADIPWSAPRYDELTKPTIAPRIIGCMVLNKVCKCVTQQGTYHHATMQFCSATIENGIFQDFEDGGGKKSEQPEAKNQPQIQPKPGPEKTASLSPQTQDSGFNLPVKSAPEKYAQKTETAPSGSMYVKGLPDSKVLLGNR